MLFNLIGDVFTRMLHKAANEGLVRGLLADFREEGVISLQYADDTIIFSSVEEGHLKNLKCCLIWFEVLSRMRINYHKSEIIPINITDEEVQEVARIFTCPVGNFPIKYLGVPLHFDKLRREDIQPLVDKIIKRIASWKGKLLSHAAKLMLIKTCLSSIPVYLLSFIKFPKWAIKILNTHMANCLWDDSDGNHKYHLVNWESVCMCKEYGGLGIPDIRDLNICLLGSWIRRYQADDGKLWKQIIDFKYKTDNPNIFYTKEHRASQFFKGFMWAARAAKMGYRWKVGNGKKIKFWEDNWVGSSSLAIQYWDLYVIVNEKTCTIEELWDGVNLKCTLRRTVDDRLERMWLEVMQIASTIIFSDEEDSMIWQFSSNGVYSSQSLYKIINNRGVLPVFVPAVWSLKIPPRVHFFLWLLSKNKNLTRDNLQKRMEVPNKTCLFCEELETSNHLFFLCVVAVKMWRLVSQCVGIEVGTSFVNIGTLWLSNKRYVLINMITSAALWAIWKFRNSMIFQDVHWRNVGEILEKIVGLLQNWIILCPMDKREEMRGHIAELRHLASRPERLQ
jgi:hypothetical protein